MASYTLDDLLDDFADGGRLTVRAALQAMGFTADTNTLSRFRDAGLLSVKLGGTSYTSVRAVRACLTSVASDSATSK